VIFLTKWKETEIGKIPEEWGLIRIGDLFFVKNGKTNTQDAVTNGNYPLFDRSTQIKSSNKYLFDLDAIIIPGEGKEFVPRYFSGKFDLHQRAYAITPKTKNICVKFFYYWMYYYRTYLERIAVGSTVRSLRLDHLVSFPAPNPILEEQKAIAKILSDLDSNIELNNQMNATLEAMAQAIFKHWFIDFEFPDENGKPYKSSGGKMVDSELGEIPEGWHISKVGKELQTALGGTPSTRKKEYWTNGDIPWINSGQVNEFRIIEPSAYITKDALDSSATKLMPKGTTVIAITGATLGQVSIIESEMCGNQSVIGIIHNKSISSEYIYFWIKTHITELISNQTGGAQQHINKDNVNSLDLLVPLDYIMKCFIEKIRPIFNQISNNCFESLNLSKIRDTILPKLMSGQIRVPVEVAK
jgi:type I restriction enzyme S subunit